MGFTSLQDIVGRSDLLQTFEQHREWLEERNIDLSQFFEMPLHDNSTREKLFQDKLGKLNEQILEDVRDAIDKNEDISKSYDIRTTDRAVLARLSGEIAYRQHKHRMKHLGNGKANEKPYTGTIDLTFTGSAGQGFGVFMIENLRVHLFGEANDSVGKTMNGGYMVITPPQNARYNASDSAIIGNCALYGATGGKMFVHGKAGDRFAVRNSGATAVVEGTGLHACEYMTNGNIVILGETSHNIGAGMTGGELYLYGDYPREINEEYLVQEKFTDEKYEWLYKLLEEYHEETGSAKAAYILKDWEQAKEQFQRYIPVTIKERQQDQDEEIAS